ncbi:conserved exported hypothetical protein [Vibrio chagasii]|uniref:hypothetical protein n=1 Tax=Vibrio sp. Makdt TaxID=2998828 RepID=UPI0022CD7953|nr:hypothetical protein [Vibrio sp. Makdt]MDA0153777.1 hypothetical protein [Vibrio sp. Makdt]CAH6876398.1 conserved exported hypothetical protein [Vibrio chagasii]CAH6903729.1 conserved exported hypothetical protein [Vibrio chagasii]
MKRMILASLVGLLSSGALASDLTYGGPYSQMKVKLCSDTPPSRSILPDGSLICDDNPPTSDSYCTGGFNYADSDIFNCGSQVEQDGDLNNNGIPDNDEDWDGDGLANGVDPNPTLNDNADIDENDNGIPDKLEPFFDLYKAGRPEFISCDGQDRRCSSYDAMVHSLSINNRELQRIINHMVSTDIDKKFETTLENLRQTMTFQEIQTRKEFNDLERAVNNIDGGVDNSGIINSGFSNMVSEFEDVDSLFSQTLKRFDDVDYDLNSVDRSLTSLNGQINGVHGHLDATQSQIIDAINNGGGGDGGLTSEQQTQLYDASKAKSNQKRIKNVQNSLNDLANKNTRLEGALMQTQMMVSSIADDVNENTNQKFNQLSDQIAAISGGQSTVDLSGVESSIDALSDKIDGIDGGSDGEGLAEISGKLDGLTNGVNDIADLLKGVDASKAGIDGTCIQGDTCQGFYMSAYDGDLSDVVSAELNDMRTSIVDPFVSSFGNINLSGAQRPKFGLPVPFYGYMSFDDYIDMDWIFGFLRFIFLASTAFYCRQIIFGG